jgi:2'-hydroxyisoflavone reductase
MDLLFIGGTRFLGKAMVSEALGRGHGVTLFNRGQTDSGLPPGTGQVLGDRGSDLSKLQGRSWDAVIDTCGYVPRIVALATDALLGKVDSYLFVSTISVYPPDCGPGQNEDAPLLPPIDSTDEVNSETYGGLKVACEQVVTHRFGERATVLRPGLVVGPGDYTDRFTFWARLFASGGPFPVPDLNDAPLQFIDVRDLAVLALNMVEQGERGPIHACGPYPPMEFHEFVERGVAAFGGQSEPRWLAPEAFIAAGIEPWSELPLVSSFEPKVDGLFYLDNSRAIVAGMPQRPIEETIRDTAAWCPEDKPLKVGPAAEKLLRLSEVTRSL